jgi:uncharacterized protein (TIGR03437 family)
LAVLAFLFFCAQHHFAPTSTWWRSDFQLATNFFLPTAAARDISTGPVAIVSAASYEQTLAPESIAALFGAGPFSATTAVGGDTNPNQPGIQLPTQLAGAYVEINGRRAGLFFVSPQQINLEIPKDTPTGVANVRVVASNGAESLGTAQIAEVAPGIFTVNGTGLGVAAANILRFKSNGQQIYEDPFRFDTAANRWVTRPIDLGPTGERVFLILYTTGVRYAESGSVRVLIGSQQKTPIFVGLSGFVGLDQINVEIPRDLLGSGIVGVSVVADGFNSSKLADIEIAGASGSAPPQVNITSNASPVLAGTEIAISGSGFVPAAPTSNIVKLGGVEAQVMEAAVNQLKVIVPYGATTGQVTVTTPQGTGRSVNDLRVRTSLSGIVENGSRQPLSNVMVCVEDATSLDMCHATYRTRTTDEGAFVLPDVPARQLTVRIDGGSVPVSPPYPTIVRRPTVRANQDNVVANLSLQQPTGSSGTIGGAGLAGESDGLPGLKTLSKLSFETAGGLLSERSQVVPQLPQQTGLTLTAPGLTLTFPGGVAANFPTGETRGTVYLTPILRGRTPAELPPNVYSDSIAQITPFGVKLNPGAKLSFANAENHAVGAKLLLYRFDLAKGEFAVVENATVTVSADRTRVETGAHDIKDTSIYFVGVPNTTFTTARGRVLCCEDTRDPKPLAHATVRIRGQVVTTDGSGAYVIRNIAVGRGDGIRAEASYLRGNGRVDIVDESREVLAVIGGLTNIEDIVMPPTNANRAPIILGVNRADVDAGKAVDIWLSIYDPDTNQQVNARVEGPAWAFLCKTCRFPGTTSVANAYLLQLRPGPNDRGEATVSVIADDKTVTTTHALKIVINTPNRPPTADEQEVETDEDKPVPIKLTASDPDPGDKLNFEIVRQPNAGRLVGGVPSVTYQPNANFNGSDSFSFRVFDGTDYSLPATVKLNVKPVNDAPVLTVPIAVFGSEGRTVIINLSATEVDSGQTMTFSGTGLPAEATITPTSTTTAQFRWTPSFTQAGTYNLMFKVADNGTPPLSDSKETRLTISDVTALSVPPAQNGTEGQLLLFDVATSLSATDATITMANAPTGAILAARGGGVWQFRWVPTTEQAGVYNVTFRLHAGGSLLESRDVSLTIADVFRDFNKEAADLTILGAHGLLPLSALDAGDALGASLAIGDVNNDGLGDLVIGAPNANSDLTDAGKVYIFYGKAALAGTIDLAQQRPDVTLLGEKAYDGFGASLAIGDVTGDGKPDLLIGAPLADQLDRKDGGKVYVIQMPLRAGDLPADQSQLVNRLALFTALGAKSGDQFGTSLAVGAFDEKIGALDFVVGAPGADTREGNDAGAVYGFWGGNRLGGLLDLSQGVASFTLTGTTAGAQAGKSLAAGNFDGDDLSDIAIGAPAANIGTARAKGAVHLVQRAIALNRTMLLSEAAQFPLEGERDGDVLGTSLAFGDYDGDGLSDLIVGVPGGDGPDGARRNSGKVMILFGARAGSVTSRMQTIYGPGGKDDQTPDEFGTAVTLGDLNGDGLADLLAGAPGFDPATEKRDPLGAVFLMLGSRLNLTATVDLATRPADLTVVGLDAGDRLGSGGLAIGNVIGGTAKGLFFGLPRAYSADNKRGEAGEVRALHSSPR